MSFLRRTVALAAATLCVVGCAGANSGTPPAPAAPAKLAHAVARTGTAQAGTLYFSDVNSVYAVPLSSDGRTAGSRKIRPDAGNNQHNLAMIATAADGSLGIMDDNFIGAGQNQIEYCRLFVEPANADGDPGGPSYPCDANHPGQASGIARNALGGFDTLSIDNLTGYEALHRLGSDGSTLINAMPLRTGIGFATDRGGHDYLSTSRGEIFMHPSSNTEPRAPRIDFILGGAPALGSMAVSPGADRTIYVATNPYNTPSISVIASGATTVSRTIGPLASTVFITQLAADSQGNVYAAIEDTSTNGVYISVYDRAASGAAAPVRTIMPDPATISIKEIRGLAISE